MRRVAGWVLAALLAGAGLTAIALRALPDAPDAWHADPLTAARTGSPNDYLVAPEGATQAVPDRIARTVSLAPAELMARFDAVAVAAPRTRRIAGSAEEMWATYVQRSGVFGFPDYVSVRAVEVPGGAALAVWSRARFGVSDFGINAARVEDWLGRIDGAG